MAKQQEFKFNKGACCAGMPADIFFYTDVDYWSVDNFLWEFDYLINYVNPSKIRIHINSVGGSVIEGMSVFAKIQDCAIPTECINDALAASMGSIIWAAGDELYMKDYALLMIHNPFCDVNGEKQYDQATEAFTLQLKTIYMKRFGLSEEDVENIMNGKDGEDGTFLTATQAIERGFIKADHIIETPKAVKDKINAALKSSKDIAQIKAVYGLVSPTLSTTTINKQNINSILETMEKNEITVFAALLGLTGEKATSENVSAKINELKAKADKTDALQKSLDETKGELTKVNAELTGAKTSIKNLNEDLDKTKATLKVYQDAEAKAKEERVAALIDKAIAECKINKEEREAYTAMAQNNFELAENVLSKIPARDNLGQIISQANKNNAEKGVQTEQQKVFAKVDEIVGKDFKFRTLD
jgi:ATP-dependent protease ClpP protease subunit